MHGAHGAMTASLAGPHEVHQHPYSSVFSQRHYNPMSHHNNFYSHSQNASRPSSRTASRPASPVFQAATLPDLSQPKNRMGSSSTVASYLQLPSTIAHGKAGSLAEFAAQITCLFWFESSSTLKSVEESDVLPTPTSPLAQEAQPVTGFLKWVTTILTTTQVTQNVVLLALLFVYRLKKQNPLVKGKPGSEYRLLTVALMLGNKFLDDNTYTNKTWAEVSGISVHEIHVMEVEFLSHMKYNLYTSKDVWDDWHNQLGKFWAYFDRACRKLNDIGPKSNSLRAPTLQIPHALPSPPNSITASPPYATSASPANFPHHNASTAAPNYQIPALSPIGSSSDNEIHLTGRKRSWDDSISHEHLAKRHFPYAPYQLPASAGPKIGQASQTPGGPLPSLPSLPVPNLSIPNNPQPFTPLPIHPHNPMSAQQHLSASPANSAPYLPPVNWLQAVHPTPASAASTPTGSHNFTQHLSNSNAPSRHQTPSFGGPNYAAGSADETGTGTPSASGYPSAAAHSQVHTQLSPSHFLSKRTSPYRPVRNISTLLVPPPSNQMSAYPANVSYNQMRWQPLSKNANERRTGRVPYLHRDAWPQTHQFDQWPSQYNTPYQNG